MTTARANSCPEIVDDLLISVWMHRVIVARKRLAAATATLAECDADAARFGLCLKTLRRATQGPQLSAAERSLNAAADAYVRVMETTMFGEVTCAAKAGALSRDAPCQNLTLHSDSEAA